MDGSDAITDRLIGFKPYREGTRPSASRSVCTIDVPAMYLCSVAPVHSHCHRVGARRGLAFASLPASLGKATRPVASLCTARQSRWRGSGRYLRKAGGDHDQTRSPAPLAFARVKSGHLGACTITGFGKDTVVCKNPSFSEVTTFGNFLPRPSSRRDSRRTIALLPLNSTLSNLACETGRRRCPLLATCTLTLQLVVS